MKLYADLPGRRARQLLADVLVLCWVAFWWWQGRQVHEATLALRAPADRLQDAGGAFGASMGDAGQQLGRVPGIGDGLKRPFDAAAGTGRSIAQVGTDLGVAVDRLALLLGVLTAAVPILIVVGLWSVRRWRFVREATSAQRFVDADADLDLFALRAMSRQPMHQLARISDDPAGAWRRREPDVVRRLALLELRSSGLRPPPQGRPA